MDVPGAGGGDILPSTPPVVAANCEALKRYRPRYYSGCVTWFVNGERAPLGPPQWRDYAESVERRVFPGGHDTMFQRPAIEVVAAQLRACLEEAHRRAPRRAAEAAAA
jgi:thioesterase domain-containing protein